MTFSTSELDGPFMVYSISVSAYIGPVFGRIRKIKRPSPEIEMIYRLYEWIEQLRDEPSMVL